MKEIKVKWLIKNHTSFYAEHEGYTISVDKRTWWIWDIVYKGATVDTCFHHPPTADELSAKIQAEKALNKLIETTLK